MARLTLLAQPAQCKSTLSTMGCSAGAAAAASFFLSALLGFSSPMARGG
jgi:hypothetical protein